MANCCCKCLLRATSVAEADGVTTITVADGTITDLCDRELVEVGLFTSLPDTTRCNRIVVTDGTTTRLVATNNQYWRPCRMRCRSILVFRAHQDPDLFTIEGVRGKGRF